MLSPPNKRRSLLMASRLTYAQCKELTSCLATVVFPESAVPHMMNSIFILASCRGG
jgi:hypothetical protein